MPCFARSVFCRAKAEIACRHQKSGICNLLYGTGELACNNVGGYKKRKHGADSSKSYLKRHSLERIGNRQCRCGKKDGADIMPNIVLYGDTDYDNMRIICDRYSFSSCNAFIILFNNIDALAIDKRTGKTVPNLLARKVDDGGGVAFYQALADKIFSYLIIGDTGIPRKSKFACDTLGPAHKLVCPLPGINRFADNGDYHHHQRNEHDQRYEHDYKDIYKQASFHFCTSFH